MTMVCITMPVELARNYQSGGTHDAFYTDKTIIVAFENYVSHVVQRNGRPWLGTVY